MLDLLLSIASLAYFSTTATSYDDCFRVSQIAIVTNLALHLLIIVPYIRLAFKTLKNHCFSFSCLWQLRKQYVKFSVMSNIPVLTYVYGILSLSLVCLYYLITQLFYWTNYVFLFATFCIICSSMSRVVYFIRLRYDLSIVLSAQVYKYFCLVITSILFIISADEQKLSAPIMAIGLIYFIYRSKESLPKALLFYFVIFFNILLASVAIAIVLISLNNFKTAENGSQQNFLAHTVLILLVTFIAIQLFNYVKLWALLKNSTSKQIYMTRLEILGQLYIVLRQHDRISKQKRNRGQHIRSKSKDLSSIQFKKDVNEQKTYTLEQQNIKEMCSICLQFEDHQKQDSIKLFCGHVFHLDCIQQWVLASQNKNCPLCRASLFDQLHCTDLI